jgi:hypothetical protein
MSAIVDFPFHRIPPVRVMDSMGPAEIVMFPGVRVERLEFDLATRLDTRRTRRQASAHAVNAEQTS